MVREKRVNVREENGKQMGENKMNKRCPKINIKCSKSDLSRARHPRAEIRSLKTNGLDQKFADRAVPDSSFQTV